LNVRRAVGKVAVPDTATARRQIVRDYRDRD
jgi:hypothetical protein